jgi:ParB/RepB/Spo0J family partition protein
MDYSTVAIDDIKITRSRFRDATGDMKGLQTSLKTFGQLVPLIVEDNLELVDGYRRYTALREIGIESVNVVFQHDIPELIAREIELETNIQREQMSWMERAAAISELDKIKRASDPKWGQTQTAQVAGVTQRDVSQAVTIAKMAELFPELKDAKSLNQALSWAKAKAASVVRMADVKNNRIDYSALEDKLLLGDSVELIKMVPDEFIDAVITDPPFGIKFDKRQAGTDALHSYEDSDESYERLLSMAPDLYRVIKPNGWLIWFLGISWYERAKLAFRDAGFTVDEIPVIWDRSDGLCYTIRPDRYFARGYDIALHCVKGDPQMIQRNKPNIIRVKPLGKTEKDLLVERPIELYAELIKRLTVQGERVADFFTGSGSCLAAAASTGRDFFGCELDPERRAVALKKIRANLPERSA